MIFKTYLPLDIFDLDALYISLNHFFVPSFSSLIAVILLFRVEYFIICMQFSIFTDFKIALFTDNPHSPSRTPPPRRPPDCDVIIFCDVIGDENADVILPGVTIVVSGGGDASPDNGYNKEFEICSENGPEYVFIKPKQVVGKL